MARLFQLLRMTACALAVAGMALASAKSTPGIGIGGPPGADTLLTLSAGAVVAFIISLAKLLRDDTAKLTARKLFAETAGGTMAGLILTLYVGSRYELNFNGAVALCGLGGAFGWAALMGLWSIVSGQYGFGKLETPAAPTPPTQAAPTTPANDDAGGAANG